MKFSSIQCFRGLAANAVLISHLLLIEPKYGQGIALLPDWTRVLGPTGVDFFFVISGFVIAYIAADSPPLRFALSRVIRIFPAYWFYTSIVLAAFLIAPGVVNTSYAHPPSILKSYLLWPQDVGPLLAVGWTLIHEMYFYLVFAALLGLRVPILPALLVWALVIAAASGLGYPASPALGIAFNPLTCLFIAGALVGLAIRAGFARFASGSLLIGVALVPAGLIAAASSGLSQNDLQMTGTGIVMIGAPFVPLIYGAAALELTQKLPWPSLLQRIGDASYSTYLCHVLVVSALGHAFARLPWHDVATQIVFLAGCLVAANVAGLVSYRLIERPALGLLRRQPKPSPGDPPAMPAPHERL